MRMRQLAIDHVGWWIREINTMLYTGVQDDSVDLPRKKVKRKILSIYGQLACGYFARAVSA